MVAVNLFDLPVWQALVGRSGRRGVGGEGRRVIRRGRLRLAASAVANSVACGHLTLLDPRGAGGHLLDGDIAG